MQTARPRLIEFHFPLQVHADDETATRLLAGDPRLTSALLYQAADDVAIRGVRSVTPVFHGDDLKKEAGVIRVEHGWLGAALVWGAGVMVGVVGTATVVML